MGILFTLVFTSILTMGFMHRGINIFFSIIYSIMIFVGLILFILLFTLFSVENKYPIITIEEEENIKRNIYKLDKEENHMHSHSHGAFFVGEDCF